MNNPKTSCTQDLTVAAFRVTVALPLGGALCQLNSCEPYRPFGYPSGDAGHDHFVRAAKKVRCGEEPSAIPAMLPKVLTKLYSMKE